MQTRDETTQGSSRSNHTTLHQNDPEPLVLQCQTSVRRAKTLAFVLVFLSMSTGLAIHDHSDAFVGNG
jgi:hypothetical protein